MISGLLLPSIFRFLRVFSPPGSGEKSLLLLFPSSKERFLSTSTPVLGAQKPSRLQLPAFFLGFGVEFPSSCEKLFFFLTLSPSLRDFDSSRRNFFEGRVVFRKPHPFFFCEARTGSFPFPFPFYALLPFTHTPALCSQVAMPHCLFLRGAPFLFLAF